MLDLAARVTDWQIVFADVDLRARTDQLHHGGARNAVRLSLLDADESENLDLIRANNVVFWGGTSCTFVAVTISFHLDRTTTHQIKII